VAQKIPCWYADADLHFYYLTRTADGSCITNFSRCLSSVGLDLNGNTFWEFRDIRGDGPGRWRRIVQYPRSVHHADVNVSPQWHQWLRHTREEPPSLDEQRHDILRQERIKVLAAEADVRWESKPSLMDAPGREHDQLENTQPPPPEAQEPVSSETATRSKGPRGVEPDDDPWKRSRGGPSEKWQPENWTPPSAPKR